MLLRSSSTPVLGSLLPSFSESPNNSNHHQSELHGSTQKHTPNSIHSKLSCTNGGSQDFRKSLFHSPSVAEIKGSRNGFRRVQSEGNLEGLADASYTVNEFSSSKKSGRRSSCCTLEAIPSLSLHHLGTSFEDDDSYDEDEVEAEERENDEELELGDASNVLTVERLDLKQERESGHGFVSLRFEGEGKMYLAAGPGVPSIDFVDGGGKNGGGGGSSRPVAFDRDGGDSRGLSMEEHYKRMLEENPGNSLFLRNYAQFLYQIKGDLGAAEEYYSRAILADPEDGEILSQYAKLIWELHRDRERAANYFERAVRASSEDSHIHAAYASFLWDAEDDEDEDEDEENAADSSRVGQPFLHHGFMASATA